MVICFNHLFIIASPLVIASHNYTLTQSLVNIASSHIHVYMVRTVFSLVTITPLYSL